MKIHEVVAHPINEMVIDREKIARTMVERGDGGVVNRVELGEANGELLGSPVLHEINLGDARDEQPQDIRIHVLRAQSQFSELIGELRRVDTARRERPVSTFGDGARESLGHTDAGDVFRRV